jgi:hypothetical protein
MSKDDNNMKYNVYNSILHPLTLSFRQFQPRSRIVRVLMVKIVIIVVRLRLADLQTLTPQLFRREKRTFAVFCLSLSF